MTIKDFLKAFPNTIFQVFKDKGSGNPQQFTEYNQDHFRKLNEQGYGIYFTPNGFKDRRKKENLLTLNAVFADLDIAKTGDGSTPQERHQSKLAILGWLKSRVVPHVIIDTKNGLQPIWLLQEGISLDRQGEYKSVIEGIIYQSTKVGCAGDQVKDVSRVLRLPNFFHMKEGPYRCRAVFNNVPRYSLEEISLSFPQRMTEEKQYLEAVENTKINQPKTTIQSEIDTVDFRQLIIHAYKSIGVIAEFDKQGRVIEDGRLTGTFQGKNGDRRYLASTSHDPKVGNQITAVTCIKKCSNKEAAEWIKKEFNLKEKVLKKQVDTILKKDEEVNNNTGEITEKEIKPFTWGTPKLDKTLWALKRYEYCLLAGLYNSGKTAYVFDLARKNAQLGHKVMYFILEMSKKELHERIALEKAGVCVEDDRFERMSDEQMKIYTESLNYLNSIKNLEIVEIPRMVKGDIFIIMEAIKRRNPDLVIIDNLGKIAKSSANISDYESETEISDQILKFTNEERIPIILVHHLNAKKTFHGSKKADMMQLRGSGKLADDADLALFVERDIEEDISDEQKAEFIIKVKKNRRKGTFTVAQVYFKDGSFYDEYEPTQEHLNPEWWTK